MKKIENGSLSTESAPSIGKPMTITEKAESPEDLHSQGYKFKILQPTKKGRGFAMRVYHKNKPVGHMVFSKSPVDAPAGHYNEPKNGYHRVYSAEIDSNHRGKGLYQHMIKLGAEHAKSLGSKGLVSEGMQRSAAATRAWDKVASHANPYTNNAKFTGMNQKNSDYFLGKSDYYRKSYSDKKKQLAQEEYNKKNPNKPDLKEDMKRIADEIFKKKPKAPEAPKEDMNKARLEEGKAPQEKLEIRDTRAISPEPFGTVDKLHETGKNAPMGMAHRIQKLREFKEKMKPSLGKEENPYAGLKGYAQAPQLQKGVFPVTAMAPQSQYNNAMKGPTAKTEKAEQYNVTNPTLGTPFNKVKYPTSLFSKGEDNMKSKLEKAKNYMKKRG